MLLALGLGGSAVLLAIDATMGIERMFHRFQRLAESGLLADVSFGERITDIAATALAVASDYPMGTLISAPRIAALIDSGYLNYYLQGKWVFMASITFMLMSQWLIGLRFLRDPLARGGALMILFLASLPDRRDDSYKPASLASSHILRDLRLLEVEDRAGRPARRSLQGADP